MWRANKRSTHLPIAAAARYHQYRSLGGGGRCQQLWERGPAEELHLRHIKTSRGEFWLSYNANQTEYSPSPPRCSSLRSISIGERKSGESPAVLGGQISRGTADAIPSNITQGEFRVRWQAMQTKYSPSPHLLCSL